MSYNTEFAFLHFSPFILPTIIIEYPKAYLPTSDDTPCIPSPCGANTNCRVLDNRPVCSCVPNYFGAPPNCRPECTTNSECSRDRSCSNMRCVDPCPGVCGLNAVCRVVNHSPICSCMHDYIGDPFTRCGPAPPTAMDVPDTNPCVPSPCGPNSICSVYDSRPVCSCIANYIGRPPNCRPECIVDSDCASNTACVCDKCKDPCVGTCGPNAQCYVVGHRPRCQCSQGFTGDPFAGCNKIVNSKSPFYPRVLVVHILNVLLSAFAIVDDFLAYLPPPTPCQPTPCGINAICTERNGAGACKCLPEYRGDPYYECRPECSMNSDCPLNRACINSKCIDPCPGTCGENADCSVVNHSPKCSCYPGYIGNPLTTCLLRPSKLAVNQSDQSLRVVCSSKTEQKSHVSFVVCLLPRLHLFSRRHTDSGGRSMYALTMRTQ